MKHLFNKLIKTMLITLAGMAIAHAEPTAQQQTAETQADAQFKAYVEAVEAATQAATKGPATVSLLDQANVALPKNFLFIPKKEATALMKASGNQVDSNFIGLIVPKEEPFEWIITVSFIKAGYVRDDDAKKWNADDLLKSIKDGTEASNKERLENGFPALEVVGWAEPPQYNSTRHHLVWSMLAKHKDSKNDDDFSVNYNTLTLGRNGFFELTLVTANSSIEKDKKFIQQVLDGFAFNKGNRYEEFTASTDRVAEYGLAALVTGAVAKKLGFFALIGAFLLKAWKLLVVLPLLFWGKIKKWFSAKSN